MQLKALFEEAMFLPIPAFENAKAPNQRGLAVVQMFIS
jgi:hypothetical protein